MSLGSLTGFSSVPLSTAQNLGQGAYQASSQRAQGDSSGGANQTTGGSSAPNTVSQNDVSSTQSGGGGASDGSGGRQNFFDHSGSLFFKQLQEYKRDNGGQAMNQQVFNGTNQ
jgi:hypothetical protein